jgi:hypothetical protein
METLEKIRSRGATVGGASRAASRRSSRTGGSRSRPSSPARLTRLLSGNHLDDHGHYHHHPDEQGAIDDDGESSTEDEDVSEKDDEENLDTTDSAETKESEEIQEVRMGVADIHDVESGPKLERKKSTRRERDPNLVDWEGPNDTENPKNWSTGRKWAATIIG